MPINRKAVRVELAAGLAAGLTTAKTVAAYQRTQWAISDTPLVRVMSGGSLRPQLTEQGMRSTFRYAVDVWVLLALQDNSWTAEDAEDTIDQIEYEIVSWLTANQLGHTWTGVQYEGMSYIEPVNIERGEIYLVERVGVAVEVYG